MYSLSKKPDAVLEYNQVQGLFHFNYGDNELYERSWVPIIAYDSKVKSQCAKIEKFCELMEDACDRNETPESVIEAASKFFVNHNI